jgi:hypothetical protein
MRISRAELIAERMMSEARQARRMLAELRADAPASEQEILDAIAPRIDAIEADAGARFANATFAEIFESA